MMWQKLGGGYFTGGHWRRYLGRNDICTEIWTWKTSDFHMKRTANTKAWSRNKLDIFWVTESSYFLEYIKLRKVVNDEFEKVDHGKIDIFNLCYSTTSFFLISRYSRAFSLSKSLSYRCHYFLFFSKFFKIGKE